MCKSQYCEGDGNDGLTKEDENETRFEGRGKEEGEELNVGEMDGEGDKDLKDCPSYGHGFGPFCGGDLDFNCCSISVVSERDEGGLRTVVEHVGPLLRFEVELDDEQAEHRGG